MAIAKVIFNNGITSTVWMDVTQDTVVSSNLLSGETATRNDGVSITGTVVTASPYDSNPAMNGTASAGSSTAYSRGDHVHPSDTSKISDPSTKSADQVLTYNGTSWIAADPLEEVFIATYNTTTYAEITAARNSGKVVFCIYNTLILPLVQLQSTGADFVGVDSYSRRCSCSCSSGNLWTGGTMELVTTARTVNGKALSSNITLTASDVGALPSSTSIPSKTSDLTNDSGFITSAGAPVQSVNGQTGAVTLSIPSATSDLTNDSGFITSSALSSYVLKTDGGVTFTKTGSASSQQLVIKANSNGAVADGFSQVLIRGGDIQSSTEPYIRLQAGTGTSFTNTVEIGRTYTTIHNVSTPSANGDAANKQYVDNSISGITFPVTSVNGSTGAVTIAVPTATSDLTNDSGFITASDIPDQIYYVEIGGTVTWSEVVAAYNVGKLIVGYYDPQSGIRGYLNLTEISIDSSSGSSSADSLSFYAVGNTGSTADVMGASWAGANIGWSYTDYTLATQTYVSDSITAAIGTAIAASY